MHVEVPDASEVNKRKVSRDVEQAKAIQKQLLEQRKTAPKGVAFGLAGGDELNALVKRWLPESLQAGPEVTRDAKGRLKDEYVGVYKPGATMRAYFDDADKHDGNLAKGWEPIVNDSGEHVRSTKGALMYKRPIEFTRDAIKFAGDLSRERMKGADSAMGAAQDGGGGDVIEDVTEVSVK